MDYKNPFEMGSSSSSNPFEVGGHRSRSPFEQKSAVDNIIESTANPFSESVGDVETEEDVDTVKFFKKTVVTESENGKTETTKYVKKNRNGGVMNTNASAESVRKIVLIIRIICVFIMFGGIATVFASLGAYMKGYSSGFSLDGIQAFIFGSVGIAVSSRIGSLFTSEGSKMFGENKGLFGKGGKR